MEEKTPLSQELVCTQMLEFETSKSNILVRNNFFLKKDVTHNVLYYQHLSVDQ